MRYVFALVLFLFFAPSVVFAANPADLTVNHRSFVSEFYKAGYDGGSTFICAKVPLNNSVNVTLFSLQDRAAETGFTQLYLAKQFNPWLDIAIDTKGVQHNLAVDIHCKGLGFGFILPMDLKNVSLGPRIEVKGCGLFLTIPTEGSLIYGVSAPLKGFKIEAAANGKIWWLRVSRAIKIKFGIFIPESRNSFSKDDHSFGGALGFIPN